MSQNYLHTVRLLTLNNRRIRYETSFDFAFLTSRLIKFVTRKHGICEKVMVTVCTFELFLKGNSTICAKVLRFLLQKNYLISAQQQEIRRHSRGTFSAPFHISRFPVFLDVPNITLQQQQLKQNKTTSRKI